MRRLVMPSHCLSHVSCSYCKLVCWPRYLVVDCSMLQALLLIETRSQHANMPRLPVGWPYFYWDECQLQSTLIIYFASVCVQIESGGGGGGVQKEKE